MKHRGKLRNLTGQKLFVGLFASLTNVNWNESERHENYVTFFGIFDPLNPCLSYNLLRYDGAP